MTSTMVNKESPQPLNLFTSRPSGCKSGVSLLISVPTAKWPCRLLAQAINLPCRVIQTLMRMAQHEHLTPSKHRSWHKAKVDRCMHHITLRGLPFLRSRMRWSMRGKRIHYLSLQRRSDIMVLLEEASRRTQARRLNTGRIIPVLSRGVRTVIDTHFTYFFFAALLALDLSFFPSLINICIWTFSNCIPVDSM